METPPAPAGSAPGIALVAGATGATGRLAVGELLARGWRVRAVVRDAGRLPDGLRQHPLLTVVAGTVLDLDQGALAAQLRDCAAVVSCLGHTMSLRGVFGPPRRLVTGSVRRLCAAIASNPPATPVRLVLMGSAGVRNRDLAERGSAGEAVALALLRTLVPPHADNEQAAEFLRTEIGPRHGSIAWAVVRPDTLTDADAAGGWTVHPSPVRSALFDPGRTSRTAVARFIAELVDVRATWEQWAGRMPVVYDRAG